MLSQDMEISSQEILEKIKKGENPLFLDVRSKEEYEAGYLKDAVSIPLDQLSKEKLEQAGIKKEDAREIIVYCEHGIRSETACELMNELGYKIKHLTGGLEKWTEKEFIVK